MLAVITLITQMGLPPLSIFLLLVIPALTSVDSDQFQALLNLRAAVNGRVNNWNLSHPVCEWSGTQCDTRGNITSLRLPGHALNGQIPIGSIGELVSLQTLSLRFNALTGPVPSDFSGLKSLRNLYLQGNQFIGPIPNFLFNLTGLVRLDLGGNKFSGSISPDFNNLFRLKTLVLASNNLSGNVPDLISLKRLKQFNVSYNGLNGSVPSSLANFSRKAFLGNFMCGKPLEICSNSNVSNSAIPPALGVDINGGVGGNGNKKRFSGLAIVGIVIGCVVGVLLLILTVFLYQKKGSTKTRSVDISSIKQRELDIPGEKHIGDAGNDGFNTSNHNNNLHIQETTASESVDVDILNAGVKKLVFFGNTNPDFDLEDLLRASAEVLGKGTFGTAYKAILESGMVVAVKRLKDVIISEIEFKEKIGVVGLMNHENLVPLRACYYSEDEKLLVYDYMPMGSLSALLHGNKGSGRNPLNWKMRLSIAVGSARGLAYLHACGPTHSHGNIKSSNVLLSESNEPRLSDFGLTQLVSPPSAPARATGYRAPEVIDPCKASQKADVYSFGILVLELLTGKAPTHALLNEEGVDLPRWVLSIVREEWTSEVFDVELLRDQSIESEMVQLLQLAIDCADSYPDKRPDMAGVIVRIEEIRGMTVC